MNMRYMRVSRIMRIEDCTGIYGLYLDGELVYIGKTTQSFVKRFSQHKRLLEFPEESEKQYDMYYELSEQVALGHSLCLKPIFVAEEVPYNSLYKLNNRDLESMEFILIYIFKPKYNVAGVKLPYRYKN